MRTAYDSIHSTVLELPDGADLYIGYDDGHWPDAGAIAARFPGKTVVRTTTNPADDEGDMLDVERGDAAPTDAPSWVARRRAAGHPGPLVYFAIATWATVDAAFVDARVPAPGYFVAAVPGIGPKLYAGSVGHQYAQGPTGDYDISVVVDYLPGIDPPPPVTLPARPTKEDLMQAVVLPTGALSVAAASPAGHLLVFTSTGRWPNPQTWSVIDVTDGLTPGNPAPKYTVAP